MSDDLCNQCGHTFDPHVLIRLTPDVTQGGIILCPTPGCQCLSTWGMGSHRPQLPDAEEIARLRAEVQGGSS